MIVFFRFIVRYNFYEHGLTMLVRVSFIIREFIINFNKSRMAELKQFFLWNQTNE